jgi:hypothetical protein
MIGFCQLFYSQEGNALASISSNFKGSTKNLELLLKSMVTMSLKFHSCCVDFAKYDETFWHIPRGNGKSPDDDIDNQKSRDLPTNAQKESGESFSQPRG